MLRLVAEELGRAELRHDRVIVRIAGICGKLKQALAEIQKLPEADQDAIAALILEEITDGRRWAEAFARSQDRLAQLAEKARTDNRAGRIKRAAVGR